MLERVRHLRPSGHEHNKDYARMRTTRRVFSTLGRIVTERRETPRPTPAPRGYREPNILPAKYLRNGMYANRERHQATVAQPPVEATVNIETSETADAEPISATSERPEVPLYDAEADAQVAPPDAELVTSEPPETAETGPTNIYDLVPLRTTHGLGAFFRQAAVFARNKHKAEAEAARPDGENQPPILPS